MSQPEPPEPKTLCAPDITPLLNVLNQFHPLSPGIEAYLNEHVRLCEVRKRKMLQKESMPGEHIYFILKGVVRAFTREGQKDITTRINVENELVFSISALNYRFPVNDNIQALEKCVLLVLSYADLETLFELFPDFNLVARKVLQVNYADAERRAFIARLTKAENRYRHFLLQHQLLSNRIPLKYIASYLGMTLETLSRVRKKISAKDYVSAEL